MAKSALVERRKSRSEFGEVPPPAKSEMEVPRFAELVALAKRRGIKVGSKDMWRRELYTMLGLSRKERVEIETKVVRHIGHRITDPNLVVDLVRYNLFYLGQNSNTGESVFEDDFRRAYALESSVSGLSKRVGLQMGRVNEIVRELGLKLKRGNGGRPQRSSGHQKVNAANGAAHFLRRDGSGVARSYFGND
jgi:hypothetical protein